MNKPIKLTDAQLLMLQQIADPNYKKRSFYAHADVWNYNRATVKALQKRELIQVQKVKLGSEVSLTLAGRAYLDSLDIAPIPLSPPPKTDKERIAELEAACKIAMDFIDHVGEASPIVFGNEAHVYHVLRRALYPNAEEV